MTTTLQNDSNFDLVIGNNGLLGVLTGDPAITQNTVTACSTRRGECLLDIERGIPFDASAFSNLKAPQFEAAIRSTMRSVQGVQGVSSVAVAQVGENLEYTAEFTTVNGTAVQVNI